MIGVKLEKVDRLATKGTSTLESVPPKLHIKMQKHRDFTHKKSPERTICAFVVIACQS